MDENISSSQNIFIEDKTSTEALENHVHIFDRVKKKYRNDVTEISLAIAQNLHKCLKKDFPSKTFVVYVSLNFEDSIIIRFHQIWEKEVLYYDPEFWQSEYDSGRLIMIK
jgi:hypothetical protein